MSGFLVVLLAAGSATATAAASATAAATAAERGQCQSVSLPTGEASRLQQHHLARCFLSHVGSTDDLIEACLEVDPLDVATSLRASCAVTLPMIAMPMIVIREMVPVPVLKTRAPMKRHQHPLHAVARVNSRLPAVGMRAYIRVKERRARATRVNSSGQTGFPIRTC